MRHGQGRDDVQGRDGEAHGEDVRQDGHQEDGQAGQEAKRGILEAAYDTQRFLIVTQRGAGRFSIGSVSRFGNRMQRLAIQVGRNT